MATMLGQFPDVSDAVVLARVDEGSNCGRLHTLPNWCACIETPGRDWCGLSTIGTVDSARLRMHSSSETVYI